MSSLGAWIIESGGLPIVPVSSTDMTMSPSPPPLTLLDVFGRHHLSNMINLSHGRGRLVINRRNHPGSVPH